MTDSFFLRLFGYGRLYCGGGNFSPYEHGAMGGWRDHHLGATTRTPPRNPALFLSHTVDVVLLLLINSFVAWFGE